MSVKWASTALTASTVDQDVDQLKTSGWSTSTSRKAQSGRRRPRKRQDGRFIWETQQGITRKFIEVQIRSRCLY